MKFAFDKVLCDCTKYGTKIPTSQYLESGKYPIIDQGQDDIAGYRNEPEGLFSDIPAIIFGDHTRIIKYVETPCFLGADGVKLLKPVMENISCKYLFYQIQNEHIPNTGYNRHFKWLKEVEFSISIPDEQGKIVAIFDEVTALISLRNQQLAKLDELVKSRFVEMFGDIIQDNKGFKTKTGAALFKISNGKATPNEKRFNAGIPAYGGNGISWYTDAPLCDTDTIVIGRVGIQSGNVHLAKAPLWVTDNAMYISEIYGDNLLLVFLYEMMEQIDFTKQQDAGDLKKVTQKPFMEMSYILPPVSLQKEYIAFVAQVDKSKFEIQKSLEKLETLKKALMQQYFG